MKLDKALLQTVATLYLPGQLGELRVKQTTGLMIGCFDDPQAMADAAAIASRDKNTICVWMTQNPLAPHAAVRPINGPLEKGTASKKSDYIGIRTLMLVDFDAAKGDNDNASEEEKAAALAQMQDCKAWLLSLGWPEPVTADSGNGAHMLFRLNLNPAQSASPLVEYALKGIKLKYSLVDAGVHDLSRVTKFYGSPQRKGVNLPERPWRQSRLLSKPEVFSPVSPDLLVKMGETAKAFTRTTTYKPAEDAVVEAAVLEFMDFYDLTATVTKREKGNIVWSLDECPVVGRPHSNGNNGRPVFTLSEEYGLGFRCWAASCSDPHRDADDHREGKISIGEVREILEARTGKRLPRDLYRACFPPRKEDFTGFEVEELTLDDDQPVPVAELEEKEIGVPTVEVEEKVEEETAADPVAAAPAAPGAVVKVKDVDDLSEDLVVSFLAVVFNNPKGAYDDFVHYRLKLIAIHRALPPEEATQHLALHAVIMFDKHHGALPGKTELLQFMAENNHFQARWGTEEWDQLTKYVKRVGTVASDVTLNFVIQGLITQHDAAHRLKAWRQAVGLAKERRYEEATRVVTEAQATVLAGPSIVVAGSLQDNVDAAYKRFEEMTYGTTDSPMKFRLGFKGIDDAIVSSNERLFCVLGAPNNFKTTLLLSIAFNLAMQGKNILFVAGEHDRATIEDYFILLYSNLHRGRYALPPYYKWAKQQGTQRDLDNLRDCLDHLKTRTECPGSIEVRGMADFNHNFDDIATHLNNNFLRNDYHALFIDPFDQLLMGDHKENKTERSMKLFESLLKLRTDYAKNRGLIIGLTLQLRKQVKNDLEKLQDDDYASAADYEKLLTAGNVDYFSAAIKKVDMLIGIAKKDKAGTGGWLTNARLRNSPGYEPVEWTIDHASRFISEAPDRYCKKPYSPLKAKPAYVPPTPAVTEDIDPTIFD